MNATEGRNVPNSRRRLSVIDFHRMAEAGIFGERHRVELINGELVDMAPIGPKHADIVNSITRAFDRSVLGQERLLIVLNPVQLNRSCEVYPDAAVVRHKRYRDAHPKPADVLLIIEVSDTSLDYDREVKIPLYAAHGIPEAWVINLVDQCAEVYRMPQPDERRYRTIQHAQDTAISVQDHPEIALHLQKLFASAE